MSSEVGMGQMQQMTAIIQREGDGYAAFCPELDVASQGDSIEDAHNNLQEAVELFVATADPVEIQKRKQSGIFITQLSVESQ